jgi:hypothetical protein
MTCLHGSEAARVRTALIHRPDRDPTGAIYTPGHRILHPTPPKSPFLASCACFPVSFWIYIAFSCLFAHYSHIPGTFQSFSFSFIYF